MAEPKRIVLKNHQAPGDLLMMTCALRDLHQQYPGEYITEVKTGLPAVFRGNPYVAKPSGTKMTEIKLGYSASVNSSNQRRAHFATGFVQHLSEILQKRIYLTQLKPDLHLTTAEKDPASLPPQLRGRGKFWLVLSGGKDQFTAKIWDHSRWQKVVDALRGEVQFVQVGKHEKKHSHKPLEGAISLLGKTGFRELMALSYHASGATCCVTSVMHLMAAFNHPCVVIDGGREPWWWEAYCRQTWEMNCLFPFPEDFQEHRYLETLGQLDCCKETACWRSGVGDKRKGNNCKKVVDGDTRKQPKCLTLIDPEQVIESIRACVRGDRAPAHRLPTHLKKPLFKEPLPEKPTPAIGTAALPRMVPRRIREMQMKEVKRREKMRGKDLQPVTGPAMRTAGRTKHKQGLYPVMQEDYERYDVDMLLPVTICSILQDDRAHAAQRTLGRLYQTVPPNFFELRVGFYGASTSTKEWVRRAVAPRGNLKLLEANAGSGYYPLMKRMLWEPGIATERVIWLDDDCYPFASEWLLKLLVCAKGTGCDLIGKKYYYHLKDGQEEWIRKAPWYRGKPFEVVKGRPSINYVDRRCWLGTLRLLKAAEWPDPRLSSKSGEVFLGEACHQLGFDMKNFIHGIKLLT